MQKFNEFAITAVGNETAVNLIQVEQLLVAFFASREVSRQQTRCTRHHTRKPKKVSASRQFAGAAGTSNNTLEKLPPAFAAEQKVSDSDLMDTLASKAPKSQKELMTDHGFDPQIAATGEFVKICECAETKEALLNKHSSKHICSDCDSSKDEHSKRKRNKKTKTSGSCRGKAKSKHCCEEHGPNPTHDTIDCEVIVGRLKKKFNWKNKDKSEGKCSGYKAKHKKKHNELNLGCFNKKSRKRRPNAGPKLSNVSSKTKPMTSQQTTIAPPAKAQ